ncbi:MAG: cell division protein SepF [Acaryochloridaceae cyanobacterium SU_2_1]|nr:cell division protein SepF [Acaryochloridaceae cyanobacterium SU_2_1]
MSIISRLRDFVGIPEADEYIGYGGEYDEIPQEGYADSYATDYPESTHSSAEQPTSQSELEQGSAVNTNSNVVGMPGTGRFWGSTTEVLVMEPRAFDEMPQVIQALRERKSVVLNLTMMEPNQAQRAVDFVAGATYTIDGHQERVGDSIFLFTPSCVQVSTSLGVVHEAPPQPSFSARPSTTSPWQSDMANQAIAQ